MALTEIFDTGSGVGKEMVGGLVAFASLGATVMKSIVRVPKGSKGARTFRESPERTKGKRQGERYGTVGTGMHLVFPFLGGVAHTTMQERTNDLQASSVELKTGKQQYDASIVWQVKDSENDLYTALFRVQDGKLDDLVKSVARTGIFAAMQELDSDNQVITSDAVSERVKESTAETFDSYGLVFHAAYLSGPAPSEAQVIAGALRQDNDGDPSEQTRATLAAVTTVLPQSNAG
jgi:regulator of protease activity HflC (stomatin/prohibitin superfamily)